MFKKILKVIGIIIFLMLIAVVLLPVLFQDKIVSKVKEEANKGLNATVDFGNFALSILTHFPDFTLNIANVIIVGKEEFEGDTLANVEHLEVTVDIMSVFKGEKIKIKTIEVEAPKIYAKVLKDGKANWDIVKSTEEDTVVAEDDSSGGFHIALNHYSFNHANVIYDDASLDFYTELVMLNHSGSGDFTQDIFVLKTTTDVEQITTKYEGVKYLSKANANIKMDLDMDMPHFKFTFKENEIQINELFLGFNGFISMAEEDIDMDITFNARKTEFKNLLSMLPAVYAKDFETVKTEGTLALNGFAKGIYNDNNLPAFGLNLLVENAMFKYPDLPGAAENIQVDVKIDNPGGSDDNTNINIAQFHVEMMDNPIDVKMKISTPISDPNIDGIIQAQIDLSNLKEIMPIEKGEQYSGSITMDVALKGRMSSIEKEQYEDFHAAGEVIVLDLKYQNEDIPYGILINKMYMKFTPQFVELYPFESHIGKSDISANGKIENFLAYTFKDDCLRGNFTMSSQFMDLNEFMQEDESNESVTTEPTDTATSVFDVPGNIDFTLNSTIQKLLYDNIEMSNVSGGITIKDKKVNLTELKMNMLDGKLVVNGSYETIDIKNPTFDFGLNIEQFDLAKTFTTFNTMQQLAPIAENATGKFSTTMLIKGQLDNKNEPVMNTLNGSGELITHNVVIENSGVMGKAADVLKMDALKKMVLNDVHISFQFNDGKVTVAPFTMKLGNGNATIAGSNGFDQSLDYVMNLDIPTSDLGAAASLANSLLGQAGMGDKVKMDVLIGGTVTNPTIKPSMSNAAGNLKDKLKDKAKEELDKKKKEAEEKARAEAERLKNEAEQKVRGEMEKAKQEAERLKQEAGQKAKAEAEKKKKEAEEKLKKEAQNKVKGLLGKPK